MSAGETPGSGDPSRRVVGVSVGESHTLALTGDGRVYSWGRGTLGRLGTGDEEDVPSPAPVVFDHSNEGAMRSGFVGVAAGAYHSLALDDEGYVWTWGYNIYGQLGYSGENSPVPHLMDCFLELGTPNSPREDSHTENEYTPLKMASSSSSSSSLFGFFFVVIVVIVARFSGAGAEEFKVGDEAGWREPPEKDSSDFYNIWAGKNRFLVGDSIYFVYNNDSVLAVDKAGYYHCNMSHPYATFNDGNTTIALNRPGVFYFVGGYPDHCKNGQRLIIRVLALHPPSPSPTSGLPPSGATEPPSPSPSSSSAVTSVPMAALASTFVALVVAMVVTICVVH